LNLMRRLMVLLVVDLLSRMSAYGRGMNVRELKGIEQQDMEKRR